MEVIGKLNAPTVLSPGKEHPATLPLLPIGKEAGWAPEPF